MKRIAVFPGTFDPFTKGHQDIALRGSYLFDELYIGVGNNSKKKRFFDMDFTLDKINETFKNNDTIKVLPFTGLTASFAEKVGARYLLRGLRNTTDFEYENSIAQMNHHVFNKLETIFIITSPKYAHISSSIVREIYKYGQNMDVFVPYELPDYNEK